MLSPHFAKPILLALAWLALVSAWSREVSAQGGKRLYQQVPFDRITIEEMGMPQVLVVQPLKLPGRLVPSNPRPTEKLRLRLVNDAREFEIAWGDIKKLELYEQIVLAETDKLIADGKLDEAFDYLVFLLDYYPKLEGLKNSRESFLYRSAGAAFSKQKYDEALAVLEELWAQNPQYRASETAPTLMAVLGNIADRMLAGYFEKEDYSSTRTLLKRLETTYKASNETFAKKWREQLDSLAAIHRDAAAEHLKAKRFAEAHDELSNMQAVWPEVEGGAALVAELRRLYPRVVIGVTHPAHELAPTSLQNPAARRTGQLTSATLMQLKSLTAEGGVYASPLGTTTLSEDGLQLTFVLPPALAAASNAQGELPAAVWLSKVLLRTADPASDEFNAAWARTIDSVRVASPARVITEFKLLHVMPQALLRNVPLPTTGVGNLKQYAILAQDSTVMRLVRAQSTETTPTSPSEVAERVYDDTDRAINGLRRGEIDVIDVLFPGDINAFSSDPNIVVAPYNVPTTHLLTVRMNHPFLSNRTFRRALLYGINRQLILNKGLLGDRQIAGSQLVSGPFPAPFEGNQQGAYAYDETVLPRPYDPRLAATLRILAEAEIRSAKEKAMEAVPKLEPLVLGHPADETSRIACRAIKAQWKLLKIECTLKEFPPGVFDDPDGSCDLVYRQLAAWEPLTDASRLFGELGIAPTNNPFIKLSLQQLDGARNWQVARQRLAQLHRLVHEEVEVLPLWQLVDHYAYRKDRVLLEGTRISLYQDIDRWLAPAAATAQSSGPTSPASLTAGAR